MTPGRFLSSTPTREASPEYTLPEVKTPTPSSIPFLDSTPSPSPRRSPRLLARLDYSPIQIGKGLSRGKRPGQRPRNASDPTSTRTRKSSAVKAVDKRQQLITKFVLGSPLQQTQSALPQSPVSAIRPTKAVSQSTGNIPQFTGAECDAIETVHLATGINDEIVESSSRETEVVVDADDDSEFEDSSDHKSGQEPSTNRSSSMPPSPPPSPSPRPKSARYELCEAALPISTRKIHEELCRKLREPLSDTEREGVIYIMCDPLRPQLGLKIGVTKVDDFEKRGKQHKYDCGFQPEHPHYSDKIPFSLRMEKLIHIDLKDHQRGWICPDHKTKPGTTHGEWYDIDLELAKSTVDKWEAFMLQVPYTEEKELEPIWNFLLNARELSNLYRDHDVRRKHFEYVLSCPTSWETFWFHKQSFVRTHMAFMKIMFRLQRNCLIHFWPLTAMVEGFFIFCILINRYAAAWFVVVTISAALGIASYEQPAPTRPRKGTDKTK